VHKRFPAGRCGDFFRGQEEITIAKLRQNRFVAFFYTTQWLDIAAFVVVWEVVV